MDAAAEIAGMSRAELTDAMRAIATCLLCDKPNPDMFGIMIPNDSQELGAPEGEQLRIVYGVCSDCHAKPDCAQMAEDKIIGDMERQAWAASQPH